MDATKYAPGYYPIKNAAHRWVNRDHIEKAPIWCSVDMRDGNQSLVIPMSVEEKTEFFRMLVKTGFKEIEVGFPAASDTEFRFMQKLADENLVPPDVSVQVLTQCREHIIRRTFEACRGLKNVIIHFYNSTSRAQREQVFNKSRDEIKKIAVDGAILVKKLAEEYGGGFRFEYSPESFTGTEPEYALEVCNEVLDVLEPDENNNCIINLPATVEMSMPHVYADQVEFMSDNLKYRQFVTLSAHPHNDRGTGAADAELALLAGADRVEGTLFGNGERTGNVDIVTLALNMFSHGVDPKLDFSDIMSVVATYERCTHLKVYERSPYSGEYVFAAFSGSHQDAIAKGIKYRDERGLKRWDIPYIPIDPADIGRAHDFDIIRINSQSGKTGISFIMEQYYGYVLPKGMREHFSAVCKRESDVRHKELRPDDVYELFNEAYTDCDDPIAITHMQFRRSGETVTAEIGFGRDELHSTVTASGNGSLDAASNALKTFVSDKYRLSVYYEHSMRGMGSDSVAAAYIGIEKDDGNVYWGVGLHTDIIRAGVKALVSAYNNSIRK